MRRIVFFAWLPLLLFGIAFVLFERAAHGDQMPQVLVLGMIQNFAPELLESVTPTQTGISPDQLHKIRHGFLCESCCCISGTRKGSP